MTSTKKILLSPPDLCFLGKNAATIQFLLTYPGKLDATRLQSSLDDCLVDFWPIASQIEMKDGTPYFVGSSTPRITIQSTTIDNEPDVSDSRIAASFTSDIDSLPGAPLAAFNLTHTPSRSLLGVSISHTIVDGYSYFYFLNCWSACFHKREYALPKHDRHLLIPSLKQQGSFSPERDFQKLTGFAFADIRPTYSARETIWETVHYSRDDLDKLTTEHGSRELSLNDLLTADLWIRYVPKWNDASDRVTVICPMDCRRLKRDLGSTYFGNLIRGVSTAVLCKDLMDRPLSETATMIRTSMSQINLASVEEAFLAMQSLWFSGGFEAVSRVHVAHPMNGFLVTNMSRLDVKGIDFGLGAPISVATPAPAKRIATVLPHPNGLCVQVSLPSA
jgi:hypothetical protein